MIEKGLRSDDGNVFLIYVSPNVAPLIQPMGQSVIRITKFHYRSSLQTSISSLEDKDTLKEFIRKDVVINLSLAR